MASQPSVRPALPLFSRVVSLLLVGALCAGFLTAIEWARPTPAQAETADVTERPDLVSAALSARQLGHKVEVTDARTTTDTTGPPPPATTPRPARSP